MGGALLQDVHHNVKMWSIGRNNSPNMVVIIRSRPVPSNNVVGGNIYCLVSSAKENTPIIYYVFLYTIPSRKQLNRTELDLCMVIIYSRV